MSEKPASKNIAVHVIESARNINVRRLAGSAAVTAAVALAAPHTAEARPIKDKYVPAKVAEKKGEQALRDGRGVNLAHGILIIRKKVSDGGAAYSDGDTGGAVYPGMTIGQETTAVLENPFIADTSSFHGKKVPIPDVLDLESDGQYHFMQLVRKPGHPKLKVVKESANTSIEFVPDLKEYTPETLVQKVGFYEDNNGNLDYDKPALFKHGQLTSPVFDPATDAPLQAALLHEHPKG